MVGWLVGKWIVDWLYVNWFVGVRLAGKFVHRLVELVGRWLVGSLVV